MKNTIQMAVMVFFLTSLVFADSVKTDDDGEQDKPRDVIISKYFKNVINVRKLASVSAAAVKIENGMLKVWMNSYGFADLENKIPSTIDTPYMLASVSKVYTGLAFMKLLEEEKVELDTDINDYLPFSVRNSNSAGNRITCRMLLNHTSSLADDMELIHSLYSPGDSGTSLEELLRDYFIQGGKYYSEKNFHSWKPGEKYAYSNIGFTLLGFIVEKRSGMPFSTYCREKVFSPLEMDNSHWFLRQYLPGQVAYNYIRQEDSRSLKRVEHYGWPGYPDGQLRASISDVTSSLLMLVSGGNYQGQQFLKEQTFKKMLEPQGLKDLQSLLMKKLDLSLVWHISEFGGDRCFVHTGRGSGISTILMFNPERQMGVALLITGQISSPEVFLDMVKNLKIYCDKM